MAYNKENRMSLNQTGSSSASYTYAEGGMGKMRSQIVDGVAATLIWDREKYLGMKE